MVPIDSLYIGIRHFPIKQHDHRPLTIYSSATIDALQTTGDRQTCRTKSLTRPKKCMNRQTWSGIVRTRPRINRRRFDSTPGPRATRGPIVIIYTGDLTQRALV